MSASGLERQAAAPNDGDKSLMERYGIIRVPVDTFRYRNFRYTNLKDAVAQAKRDADAGRQATVSTSD